MTISRWTRPLGLAMLFAALWVASTPAGAQTAPDTVWLEDLTWTELRDLIKGGTTTIIIAVGGVEQSGPAMALGKHDARAKLLAETIARRLGHTLVAPVIAYVPEGSIEPPTAHMRFPGTITVPEDVFRKTLESAAMSFKLHGFKDIVLIGDHGGYQGDLAAVAAHLDTLWAKTPVRAHYIADYYRAATGGFSTILKEHGYSAAEIGTHAGAADTSLSMAADPRLVRADRLAGGDLGAAQGVYGDPHRSSATMGKLGLDAIAERATAAIRTAIAAPR
jgi:creatinine amidohydrolase/Fe(II)-dependent formamide hydrolase-like protein